VKSMAGEALGRAEVSWQGLAGDRRWAFVRDDMARSAFPWLTIRERSEMARYRPCFADPERPEDSRTLVRTPGGAELDVLDPALVAELGGGARVIKQNRGTFDWMPLSLLSLQSIARLEAFAGRTLDVRRFRPNLVVDAADGAGFQEDEWLGATVRIGGLRMRITERDPRCAITTVDPDTSERDPSVLRTIAERRDACFGVYGSTLEPGRVAVGDAVVLETR
jgi:MOSC domain-containing protein